MSQLTEREMAPATPSEAAVGPLRQWIIRHDDSWLFTIAYVGLAVVLSIWISLFWLVAVVGVHGALEWIRQSHLANGRRAVARRVLWELKLDIALVLFALALTAYMELVLGLAGLGGAARLSLQAGTRLAGWSRVLRGVLLSLDDAAQLGRAALARGGDDQAPAAPAWNWGDRIAFLLGGLSLAALLLAPLLTDHHLGSLVRLLLAEMHPLP